LWARYHLGYGVAAAVAAVNVNRLKAGNGKQAESDLPSYPHLCAAWGLDQGDCWQAGGRCGERVVSAPAADQSAQ